MAYTFAAGTHTGQREKNEDSYVCSNEKGLWMVADGVGGLALGESASAILSHTISTMIFSGQGINQSIEAAHLKVQEYSRTEVNGANMGATLVLLYSSGTLYNVFWAGDCRAYLFNGNMSLLTRDHTHLQHLIDNGDLTEEEAADDSRKNGITKAVGIQQLDTVRAESVSRNWQANDKILMCSDGLSGYVPDEEIARILDGPGSDQDHVDELIDTALKAGSLDNITVVLVAAPSYITQDFDDSTAIPEDLDLNEFNRER
jgi:PPM family protein phosphatase